MKRKMYSVYKVCDIKIYCKCILHDMILLYDSSSYFKYLSTIMDAVHQLFDEIIKLGSY